MSSSSLLHHPQSGLAETKPKRKTFSILLHEMLCNVEATGIVSWAPHGRAFIILRPREFVQFIMPRYFRHKSWESFVRQLNIYGFGHVAFGPDRGYYYHAKFLRERPDLCNSITRQEDVNARNEFYVYSETPLFLDAASRNAEPMLPNPPVGQVVSYVAKLPNHGATRSLGGKHDFSFDFGERGGETGPIINDRLRGASSVMPKVRNVAKLANHAAIRSAGDFYTVSPPPSPSASPSDYGAALSMKFPFDFSERVSSTNAEHPNNAAAALQPAAWATAFTPDLCGSSSCDHSTVPWMMPLWNTLPTGMGSHEHEMQNRDEELESMYDDSIFGDDDCCFPDEASRKRLAETNNFVGEESAKQAKGTPQAEFGNEQLDSQKIVKTFANNPPASVSNGMPPFVKRCVPLQEPMLSMYLK
jgi:hypothetical protein